MHLKITFIAYQGVYNMHKKVVQVNEYEHDIIIDNEEGDERIS